MRAALARILGAPLSRADRHEPADAIVILGCALLPDGSLSAPLAERVRAGAAAFAEKLAPMVVATGGATGGREPEAAAMRRALESLGVPASAILTESESLSTFENARHCAALLLPKNIRRVWIVTQPFHMRRSLRHFRRAGFAPLALGIENSLQFRDPAWGLARVASEYVSWAKTLLLWR